MSRRRAAGGLAGVAAVVGLGAAIAAVTPTSAFQAQAADGRALYQRDCLVCHGGVGGPGVPGRTEPLEGARFVARNPSALEIYDVVRSGREGSLRALSDEQLFAAIAAELQANGVDLGSQRLGLANAGGAGTGIGAHVDPGRFTPPGR